MEYDVIIVGARVAGASLAILLGRQGRRVLLVDGDRFPSDTLSTHFLLPPAVDMLARLGALAEVEALGYRRITRRRTYLGDCMVEGRIRPPGPGGAAGYGLCPRRDRLDWILIQRALAHSSVEFRPQTAVEGLLWDGGRVAGARLRARDGSRRTVYARVVVGADGRHSRMAGWVGAPRYHEVPPIRPVYYAYYRGVEPLPEPANEVFFQDGRIGYVLPMEPGVDCLVLEPEPDEFSRFRADAAAEFDAALRALPGMARRLAAARREGPVLGTRGVENFLRVPAGPGWALTGDAALCKDPSTATGIQDAFTQSFLLAEALGATLDGADWEATMRQYRRYRDAAVLSGYQATVAFTQAPEVPAPALAWLAAVLANSGLVRALAAGLPAACAAEVFPSELLPVLAGNARAFAAADPPPRVGQAA
jgi:2-polyprenyl-6-methoxyphenol hydroxylase-like FAD-dependent oxidoreductase